MRTIGMIDSPPLLPESADADEPFPADAELCAKCYTKAVVSVSGCLTCLNCGESKCG